MMTDRTLRENIWRLCQRLASIDINLMRSIDTHPTSLTNTHPISSFAIHQIVSIYTHPIASIDNHRWRVSRIHSRAGTSEERMYRYNTLLLIVSDIKDHLFVQKKLLGFSKE